MEMPHLHIGHDIYSFDRPYAGEAAAFAVAGLHPKMLRTLMKQCKAEGELFYGMQ
jgi:hypothetical protein